MYKALAMVLVLGLAGQAWAEDDVEALVEALEVNDLRLSFHEGSEKPFYYIVQKDDGTLDPRELPSRLTVAADSTLGLNITLQYLNPIKYSWSTSEAVSDDPTYTSAGKFLESMKALLGTVSPTSPGAAEATNTILDEKGKELARDAAVNELRKARAAGEREPKVNIEQVKVPALYAPELLGWALWMSNESNNCTETNEAVKALNEFVNTLGVADANLYEARKAEGTKEGEAKEGEAKEGEAKEGQTKTRASTEFKKKAEEIIKAFLAAPTVKDLKASVRAHKDAANDLQVMNKEATKVLDDVKVKLTALSERWKKDQGFCDNLMTYTTGVLGQFDQGGRAMLATREQLASDLQALTTNITTMLSAPGTNAEKDLFTITRVPLPEGKMKDVTITVRQRDVSFTGEKLNVEEKKSFNATVRVREYQTIIVEFAPGVAYTNVAYPRFGTAQVDGRTVVAESGKDVQHTTVVGMLNLIPNWGWRGIPWVMGQIGVGTGKDYPLLLAGGGVRFGSPFNLSITMGAAWTWTQRLNDLKPGDEVTGTADIEKDLSFQLQARPKFYLGIQRGF